MLLIQGEWIETPNKVAVKNPYTGKVVGEISQATKEQVLHAAKTAKAYRSTLSAFERATILNKTAAVIEAKEAEYVQLIVDECGACAKEAQKEVKRAVNLLRVCAEEAKRIYGEAIFTDTTSDNKKNLAFTIREPIGLVCAITPFNRPLNQVVVKLAPAIAANNSVLLKPSEKTPLSAIKFVKTLIEQGLPSKMVSLVSGDPKEIGDTLIQNPYVDMITFTGSRKVGEMIASKAGMIRTAFELGDSGALIVLADADLKKAVDVAVKGAYATAGQSCRGIKRILVQETVADEFVKLLAEATEKITFGDPYDKNNEIGCLISEEAAKSIEDVVKEAVASGAKLVYGKPRQGAVLGPQVLDNVSRHAKIVAEETFGPCAPVVRIKDVDDAITCVNELEYGLQTGVFTNNMASTQKCIYGLQTGAVIINDGPQFESAFIPFGGVKKSGLGREGARYTIMEMTTIKTVVM